MEDGHSSRQLKAEIIALSKAKDWDTARKEWKLQSISDADEPQTCLCGHFPIIELCSISNETTGKAVEVGNVCVKRFLGFRSDLIFAGIKRISKDLGKSLGPDGTVFFHQRGVINDWEYNFQQSTMRKRDLSEAQLTTRQKINQKVLLPFKRRGISV